MGLTWRFASALLGWVCGVSCGVVRAFAGLRRGFPFAAMIRAVSALLSTIGCSIGWSGQFAGLRPGCTGRSQGWCPFSQNRVGISVQFDIVRQLVRYLLPVLDRSPVHLRWP